MTELQTTRRPERTLFRLAATGYMNLSHTPVYSAEHQILGFGEKDSKFFSFFGQSSHFPEILALISFLAQPKRPTIFVCPIPKGAISAQYP